MTLTLVPIDTFEQMCDNLGRLSNSSDTSALDENDRPTQTGTMRSG